MASRRRVAVALLFTAAGITPMVALGSAWGGQGFTASTVVTVDGRTAATFPIRATAATSVPAAGPAAAAPQVIQPPPVAVPAESAPAVEQATAPPSPTRAAKPSRTPKSAPPSAEPSTSETTGN